MKRSRAILRVLRAVRLGRYLSAVFALPQVCCLWPYHITHVTGWSVYWGGQILGHAGTLHERRYREDRSTVDGTRVACC